MPDCHSCFILMKNKTLIIGHHEASSIFKLTLMRGGGEEGGWAFLLELPHPKQNKKTPSKVLCTMQTN